MSEEQDDHVSENFIGEICCNTTELCPVCLFGQKLRPWLNILGFKGRQDVKGNNCKFESSL